MKKRGRKPATGKYQTHGELVEWVHFFYRKTGQNQAQVARTCGVSEGTVARILTPKNKRTVDTVEIDKEAITS